MKKIVLTGGPCGGKTTFLEALEKELEIGQPIFASEDMMEGLTAFAEKRKPNFKGK